MAKTVADLSIEEAAAFATCGYAHYPGCLSVSTGHTFHNLIGTHHQQDVALDKLCIDGSASHQHVLGSSRAADVDTEALAAELRRCVRSAADAGSSAR